ncbi:MAG: hypothetical protein IPJ56_05235 [Gemmatimonadetes bacterium]|nr:hypothetical protein [Gemmatimonadota bacterium]
MLLYHVVAGDVPSSAAAKLTSAKTVNGLRSPSTRWERADDQRRACGHRRREGDERRHPRDRQGPPAAGRQVGATSDGRRRAPTPAPRG